VAELFRWLALLTAAEPAAAALALDRTIHEHERVVFGAQVPGIDLGSVDQRERNLVLFEYPARPTGRHRATVRVPQRDTRHAHSGDCRRARRHPVGTNAELPRCILNDLRNVPR
jgi:hypothetical protein